MGSGERGERGRALRFRGVDGMGSCAASVKIGGIVSRNPLLMCGESQDLQYRIAV